MSKMEKTVNINQHKAPKKCQFRQSGYCEFLQDVAGVEQECSQDYMECCEVFNSIDYAYNRGFKDGLNFKSKVYICSVCGAGYDNNIGSVGCCQEKKNVKK